jgi:hypothetical protein
MVRKLSFLHAINFVEPFAFEESRVRCKSRRRIAHRSDASVLMLCRIEHQGVGLEGPARILQEATERHKARITPYPNAIAHKPSY